MQHYHLRRLAGSGIFLGLLLLIFLSRGPPSALSPVMQRRDVREVPGPYHCSEKKSKRVAIIGGCFRRKRLGADL